MRVLISGASSFIGRELLLHLLACADTVIALVRDEKKIADIKRAYPRLEVYVLDMYDIEKASLPVADVCVHLAWVGTDVEARMDENIQEVNIFHTLSFMKKAQVAGVKRFIFAGSQAEYGFTLEYVKKELQDLKQIEPITEKMPPHPISAYGKVKLRIKKEGGELAESMGMEYVHMRIFSVYGPGDHATSLVSSCVEKMLAGEDVVLGSCRQMWNFLYITDCAKAIVGLVHMKPMRELVETVNIASKTSHILSDFVREIAQVLASESAIIFDARASRSEGTPYLVPSIQTLETLIDFKEEVSFAEGIRKIAKRKKM